MRACRLSVLVLAVASLAAPASASAHAKLRFGSPAVLERLAASPSRIRLIFDQPVKAFPDSILVQSDRGRIVSAGAGDPLLLLRAEDVLQLPFTRFLDRDLSPIAGGTRHGTAFIAMTLGFALVAASLFLA